MFALISAIFAVVFFFLALVGVSVGIDLVVLGFFFLALAIALGHWPVTRTWRRD